MTTDRSLEPSNSFRSLDPEIPRDFDLIIQQINQELQRLFMISSLERCSDSDVDIVRGRPKVKEFILPVDCIKIEPY